MEGIQGAVLGIKLKHLEEWTNGRRKVAAKYRELLGNLEQILLPIELPDHKHVYHLFVVRVNGRDLEFREETRNKLQSFLSENGIASGLHYPVPLHLQNCFKYLGYSKGDFPVTEDLARTGLSLPMFPELTDEQIEYVSSKVKEFFYK
jgi:dTDP-4-amino-4,6-dideoxygalactose transaminase